MIRLLLNIITDWINTASQIQSEFKQQCIEKNVPFVFIHEIGSIEEGINRRAQFTDLLLLPTELTNESEKSSHKTTKIETLLQDCCTPVLATNTTISPLKHALIGYDASPKSEEAMYLAAYITRFWESKLSVVTALTSRQARSGAQQKAKEYLESYGIEAEYIETPNPPSDAILEIAEQHGCDFIIIGGYGIAQVIKSLTGSVVDDILGKFEQSILICR